MAGSTTSGLYLEGSAASSYWPVHFRQHLAERASCRMASAVVGYAYAGMVRPMGCLTTSGRLMRHALGREHGDAPRSLVAHHFAIVSSLSIERLPWRCFLPTYQHQQLPGWRIMASSHRAINFVVWASIANFSVISNDAMKSGLRWQTPMSPAPGVDIGYVLRQSPSMEKAKIGVLALRPMSFGVQSLRC